MLFSKASLVSALLYGAAGVLGQGIPEGFYDGEEGAAAQAAANAGGKQLAAIIKATFPDSEFGVNLVNGRATKAVVTVENHEDTAISVAFVGGQLTLLEPPAPDAPPYASIVRNLTAVKYQTTVEAGAIEELPFTFALDMHPQELLLTLSAVISSDETIFQALAYNGTVNIVEAPTSILDPQIIFLYLILTGAFAGTLYFVYNTWISTLFPQAKRAGKGGASKAKKAVLEKEHSLSGSESAAAGTASGVDSEYDQSWIPSHHINRPVAKRVKSSASGKGKRSTD